MTSKNLFALPVILCLFLKIATKLAMALLHLLSVHVCFSYHPHKNKRKTCCHDLLKLVSHKNGVQKLYPLKLFCYESIKSSISSILSHSGMATSREKWREKSATRPVI